MLRDTQIIGCADMPQRADMPLLPLLCHFDDAWQIWTEPLFHLFIGLFILFIVVNFIKYLINNFSMNNLTFLLFYLTVNFTVLYIIINIRFNT